MANLNSIMDLGAATNAQNIAVPQPTGALALRVPMAQPVNVTTPPSSGGEVAVVF